jgi:hypothetical protein
MNLLTLRDVAKLPRVSETTDREEDLDSFLQKQHIEAVGHHDDQEVSDDPSK